MKLSRLSYPLLSLAVVLSIGASSCQLGCDFPADPSDLHAYEDEADLTVSALNGSAIPLRMPIGVSVAEDQVTGAAPIAAGFPGKTYNFGMQKTGTKFTFIAYTEDYKKAAQVECTWLAVVNLRDTKVQAYAISAHEVGLKCVNWGKP